MIFPPGRFRLVTRPYRTGSSPTLITIGILDVARFAASAESSPPLVTIMATFRRTKSSASVGRRLVSARHPIGTRFQRSCRRRIPSRSALVGTLTASTHQLSDDRALESPITGIVVCCARAAKVHGRRRAANQRDERASPHCPSCLETREPSVSNFRRRSKRSNVAVRSNRKSGRATGRSALPSRTDLVSPACQVRKYNKRHNAITSSARVSEVDGELGAVPF